MTNMSTFTENRHDSLLMQKEIPVLHETDVLVVGGGPAGVSAAFAAAELGKKVMIVEQFNCLGGVATAGGHGHICLYSSNGTDERIVGGHTFEIAKRVARAGYGVHDNSFCDFEVEGMKLVLEEMASELGVELLYHSFFSDAYVDGKTVKCAIIQNKNGLSAIRAKMIVDATGDGDVAAMAGCKFEYGEDGTGNCQPVTLMFTIGGVDYDRVREFRGNDYKLEKVWKSAQKNGDMRPFQHCIMGWWWTPTRPDQLGINFTHVNFINALKAEDLTAATLEARKQAYESIQVYRKYIPGMEKCHIISTPNTIGIRESRRIVGKYTLTKNDVLSQRNFPDSIGYGSFFIDIHNCSGPGMDKKTVRPDNGFKYQIPYRILVPEGINNLLVAGRCASTDHEALGSLRVMPQCGVMGEAAGAAAAIAIDRNCTAEDVPVQLLQSVLRKLNCIVDENDISVANTERPSI